MLIDLHGAMLSDRGRNAAFARAIRAAVQPGSVVVDAGSGTGLLALLSARAGAGCVYALERDPVLATLARETVRRNGLERIITVVCGDARTFRPDLPVDLIVSETVGIFLFEEGILALRDALAPHLAPGGRFLPARMALFAAPIHAPRLERDLARSVRLLGFDYSARVDSLMNRPLPYAFHITDLLAPALPVSVVDLAYPSPDRLEFAGTFRVNGRLSAIGLYFKLELFDGIFLCTAPDARPTHWERFVLPLPAADVTGELRITLCWHGPSLAHLTWTAESAGYCATGATELGAIGIPLTAGF